MDKHYKMKQDIFSKTRERGVGKGETKPLNNLTERQGEKRQPGGRKHFQNYYTQFRRGPSLLGGIFVSMSDYWRIRGHMCCRGK